MQSLTRKWQAPKSLSHGDDDCIREDAETFNIKESEKAKNRIKKKKKYLIWKGGVGYFWTHFFQRENYRYKKDIA